MSVTNELMTHIDLRVVRNLLDLRLNEGREIMKNAATPAEWRHSERRIQEKCRDAMKILDEAISIREGKTNEASIDPKAESTAEGDKGARKTGVPGETVKA